MFIVGLLLLSFGLSYAVSMSNQLSNIKDFPYIYQLADGVTEQDITMWITGGYVLAAVGVVLIIAAWLKHKSDCATRSLLNAQNQKYCSNCNINVVSYAEQCPICQRPLQ